MQFLQAEVAKNNSRTITMRGTHEGISTEFMNKLCSCGGYLGCCPLRTYDEAELGLHEADERLEDGTHTTAYGATLHALSSMMRAGLGNKEGGEEKEKEDPKTFQEAAACDNAL